MRIIKTFIWFFILTLSASAQERNNFLVQDMTRARLSIAQPEWQISTETNLSPQSIRLLYGDLTDLLIQPHGVLDEGQPWMFKGKTDLLSPWKLELQDQAKYRTWRNILGSVQIGGAAYLGYLYLKKHGLK